MTHVHMFQWNIPAENHFANRTDKYLNIIATWNSEHFYNDGSPMVFVDLVNPNLNTCQWVKNWILAEQQIKEVAREHFSDLARKERINKARAELIAAGEIIYNPVLLRYEPNQLNSEIILNDELPY